MGIKFCERVLEYFSLVMPKIHIRTTYPKTESLQIVSEIKNNHFQEGELSKLKESVDC